MAKRGLAEVYHGTHRARAFFSSTITHFPSNNNDAARIDPSERSQTHSHNLVQTL